MVVFVTIVTVIDVFFREINGQTPVVTPATKTHLQQFEVTARKS